MICFIDTNIFLRVIVRENEKVYSACYEFLRSAERGEVLTYTSHIVLAEVVWTLDSYYRLPKTKINKSLQGIDSMKLDFTNKFDTAIAHELFRKYSVKYNDALIVSIPEVYTKKWTVVSYDKDFDKLGILRKEPREVVNEMEKR